MAARVCAATPFALLLVLILLPIRVSAGTTGGLSGTVTASDTGAPIADVSVEAVSASQIAATRSDNNGRFVFVSLHPDAYVVSVAKNGFEPKTLRGVRVVADQTFTLDVPLKRILKTIAAVLSRSSADLVRPGSTSDVYSISAPLQAKLAPLNGGNDLNTLFSALASVPGVYEPAYQAGWGHLIYIRGADFNQIGWEYDGVPINRAFDFYAGTGFSTLGQQDLEIYTGGSPANAGAPTLAGYINQVIKTGTHPGFGNVAASAGYPAFYHSVNVETGGADPNRRFSYYAGALGFNQTFHLINVNDGANLQLSYPGLPGVLAGYTYTNGGTLSQGIFPPCVLQTAPYGEADILDPYQLPGAVPPPGGDPGCIASAQGYWAFGGVPQVADREVVTNFHVAILHKYNSGRDDLQLLYSSSMVVTTSNTSYDDFGGNAGYGAQLAGICPLSGPNANCVQHGADPYGLGLVACAGTSYNCYTDGVTFPTGTVFGQPASGITAVPYYFPLGPKRTGPAAIPDNERDTTFNDANIIKVQYQKNIGTKAYVRLFGYTDYSDWLYRAPNYVSSVSIVGSYPGTFFSDPDYELSSHSRGASLQFAAQMGSKHLFSGSADYTEAKTLRYNQRTTIRGSGAPATNLVGADGNCYAWTDGTVGGQDFTRGMRAPCFSKISAGTFDNPTQNGPLQCNTGGADAGTPACTQNAQWIVTVPGGVGTINTVFPQFSNFSLQDEYRPNSKLYLNVGLRHENYVYNLTSADTPDYTFWFKAARNELCYDPATGVPVHPRPPLGSFGPQDPFIGFDCSLSQQLNAVHPNSPGHYFTNLLPATTVESHILSPRLAFTYTVNANSVIRGSAGRYTEPAASAWVEYLDASARGSALFNFTNFWGVGFTSPRHNIPTQASANFDLSFEHRLTGTQISYKITPFYRLTQNQYEFIPLYGNFLSNFAAGTQKSYGVEFQVNVGDVSRAGLSGQFSYTYTRAAIRYQNTSLGTNPIDFINGFIRAYDGLTKGGGGAPCYNNALISPSNPNGVAPPGDCTVTNGTVNVSPAGLAANDVINPYYLNAPQPQLDRNGWYPATEAANFVHVPPNYQSYYAPNVFAGWLNYRHGKIAISPSFNLAQGGQYGSPLEVIGEDPRTCTGNQSGIPTARNPGLANYLTCGGAIVNGATLPIPNPFTGRFDNVGQYQQPWTLLTNLSLTYDVSPKIELQFIAANLYNTCFGGSRTPWSAMFPPNRIYCAFTSNGLYISNFYNGSSPFDEAANGSLPFAYQLMPYGPSTIGQQPAQFTLTMSVKM